MNNLELMVGRWPSNRTTWNELFMKWFRRLRDLTSELPRTRNALNCWSVGGCEFASHWLKRTFFCDRVWNSDSRADPRLNNLKVLVGRRASNRTALTAMYMRTIEPRGNSDFRAVSNTKSLKRLVNPWASSRSALNEVHEMHMTRFGRLGNWSCRAVANMKRLEILVGRRASNHTK